MQKIVGQLANEIKIRPEQVRAAIELIDGGATVPFIARYRKEVTGGLDDIQLRELEARLAYLRDITKKVLTDKEALAEFEQRNQPALYGDPEEMTRLVTKALDGSIGEARLKEVKYVITEKYY